jgi:hypothetical protein
MHGWILFTTPVKCKVWLSLFRFSRNSEVFGHLQVEFQPDGSRNMKSTVQINLRPQVKYVKKTDFHETRVCSMTSCKELLN